MMDDLSKIINLAIYLKIINELTLMIDFSENSRKRKIM